MGTRRKRGPKTRPALEEWHDEILVETHPSMIECLEKDAKLFSIERTPLGYRMVELCDGYYGTTLSQSQLERLIADLQDLAALGPEEPEEPE